MGNEVVVIGSINMDMVINVDQMPKKGETVLGGNFFMNPGGKGANQAYSAATLGTSITMLGCVGNDVFGDNLLQNLHRVGVNTTYIKRVADKSSGIAMITVDGQGENSIIVSPAANGSVAPAYINEHEFVIEQAKAILIQLEIPLDAVEKSIEIAKKHHVPVLLDPAPARALSDQLLSQVDYILPNEYELEQLTNINVYDQESAREASNVLLAKGVGTVISKLGNNGVIICQKDHTEWIKGHKVEVVDTTGAGDAFAGGFVSCLVNGKSLPSCTAYANAVGALAVTKEGAQAAVPKKEEVESFIEKSKQK